MHKEIEKQGRGVFGGGGREYERTGELRQSPSEACAFWPVEAVNRQGSLVFCA